MTGLWTSHFTVHTKEEVTKNCCRINVAYCYCFIQLHVTYKFDGNTRRKTNKWWMIIIVDSVDSCPTLTFSLLLFCYFVILCYVFQWFFFSLYINCKYLNACVVNWKLGILHIAHACMHIVLPIWPPLN